MCVVRLIEINQWAKRNDNKTYVNEHRKLTKKDKDYSTRGGSCFEYEFVRQVHWFSTFFMQLPHLQPKLTKRPPSKNFQSGIYNAVVFAQ